jgi:hypothetical protein
MAKEERIWGDRGSSNGARSTELDLPTPRMKSRGATNEEGKKGVNGKVKIPSSIAPMQSQGLLRGRKLVCAFVARDRAGYLGVLNGKEMLMWVSVAELRSQSAAFEPAASCELLQVLSRYK